MNKGLLLNQDQAYALITSWFTAIVELYKCCSCWVAVKQVFHILIICGCFGATLGQAWTYPFLYVLSNQ